MRSAKSVACNKLKVVGVSIFLFLPRRIVSWTRGEEFHSLNATAIDCERSHRLSRASWVDLPEPSIPSTIISFPLKRFGANKGGAGGRLSAEKELSLFMSPLTTPTLTVGRS